MVSSATMIAGSCGVCPPHEAVTLCWNPEEAVVCHWNPAGGTPAKAPLAASSSPEAPVRKLGGVGCVSESHRFHDLQDLDVALPINNLFKHQSHLIYTQFTLGFCCKCIYIILC